FAMAASFTDQLAASRQCRTDRCTEALAEADADGVEMPSPLGGRNAGRRDGVEQPGTIQVRSQSIHVSPRADRFDVVVGLDATGPAIMRVLETDQARTHQVLVFRPDQIAELIDMQAAVVAFDGPSCHAA